jgi:hypothetical protein
MNRLKLLLAAAIGFVGGYLYSSLQIRHSQINKPSLTTPGLSLPKAPSNQVAGDGSTSGRALPELPNLLYSVGSQLDDILTLEEVSKRMPTELQRFLASLDLKLPRHQELYYLGMMSLFRNNPDANILSSEGVIAMIQKLPRERRVEILAQLPSSDLHAMLSESRGKNPSWAICLTQAAAHKLVRTEGLDAGLELLKSCPPGNANESPSSITRVISDNLLSSDSKTLNKVYNSVKSSLWWDKDDAATQYFTAEMAKFSPKIALEQSLTLKSQIRVGASQEAVAKWYESDPQGFLDYLPTSGVTDKAMQITWLHAILKRTNDQGLRDEIAALIKERQ